MEGWITVADQPEEPIILESVHRHGVTEEDMLHALRFAIHHVSHADDMVMFIGPDAAGTLIEAGVVIWWSGELAIAHALPSPNQVPQVTP